jgi:catechol 2,3-dioxygenase-like lactoylglutathione lyase family enzyme
MWGKPPFEVGDGFVLEVSNLEASRRWYKETLGFRDAPEVAEDDSGRPFLALKISDHGPYVSLLEKGLSDSVGDTRPIFFVGSLTKTRDWLTKRGVAVGPTEADSGGNQFFKIQDLDGNSIEVCVEP